MTTEKITEQIQFAYWVPNVSGGLVTSTIDQRTGWDFEYNKKLAQTAENNGFDYALSQVRYMASYGAEYQHESTSFSLALLGATERLKVIAAVHPGLWHPAVLAKLGATADHLSNGRFAINVVSGWFAGEFTALGEPWLEHDERYRRSAEFLEVISQDLDRGQRQLRRRLLPYPRLHAEAEAAQHTCATQSRAVPRWQLDRGAPQWWALCRLVLLQRQGLRRCHRTAERCPRLSPGHTTVRSGSG